MTEEKPRLHIESDWKCQVQEERSGSDPTTPELHVDSDWKAQAQAEKERLASASEEKAQARAAQGGGAARGLPEPDFRALIGFLAQQAISGMGVMGDPDTGRVIVDLEGSKFWIELLAVLEEKSAGNLSDEESAEITQVLVELRSHYVQITQVVAQQAAEGKAVTMDPTTGLMGSPPPGASPTG